MKVKSIIDLLVDYNMRASDYTKKNQTGLNPARDQYIHSSSPLFQVYEKKQSQVCKYTPEIMDYINFHHDEICRRHGNEEYIFKIKDKVYSKKDLPKVSPDRCKEIKANNNEIAFDNMNYYKYQDEKGNLHIFSCLYNNVQQPQTDLESGRQNRDSLNIGIFWNILSTDGTFLGLRYSDDEERKYLNDAGIYEGFFSVRVGKNRQEYFYSKGNQGVSIKKSDYDSVYDMLTNSPQGLSVYEVGSVFKIAGKDYILGEDRKLDIPYGEDIFDIEYPLVDMTK